MKKTDLIKEIKINYDVTLINELSQKNFNKYFSKLNIKELKELKEILNSYNKHLEPITINKNKVPNFDKKPTKKNFLEYYNELKELNFKDTTINNQVTKLRKIHKNVPAYNTAITNQNSQIRNNIKRNLNIKISLKKVYELINILKNSNNIIDKYLTIALATGRRENEILNINNFDFNNKNENTIVFSGQSKLKNRKKFEYEIPFFGLEKNQIKEILIDIDNYKKSNENEFEYLTDITKSRIFNGKINNQFNKYIKILSSDLYADKLLKPHNLRSIYAQIIVKLFNKNNENELTLFSKILGHDKNDISTQNHYKLITLVNDLEKTKKESKIITYSYNHKRFLEAVKDFTKKEKISNFVYELKNYYKEPQTELKFFNSDLSNFYRKQNIKFRNAIKYIFQNN